MSTRLLHSLILLILFATQPCIGQKKNSENFSTALDKANELIGEEDFEPAIDILNELATQNLSPAQAVDVYSSLVEVAIKVADYTTAEFYLEEAYEQLPKVADGRLKMKMAYVDLYLLMNVGGGEVINRGLKLLRTLQPGADSTYWFNIHSMIGLGYLDRRKPDSTIYHFNIAIAGYEKLNNRKLLADALQNKGYAMLLLGEVDAAFAAFEKSVELARQVHNLELEIEGIMLLGKAYLTVGDFNTARQFLDSASRLVDPNQASLIDTKMFLAGFYTELFTATEDYKSALYWDSMNDSLIRVVRDQEILMRLALAPSRQTIQQQELALSQSRQGLWVLGLAMSLVVVVVFSLWRILRMRNKSAEALRVRNEEIHQQNMALKEQSERLQQQKEFIKGRNTRLDNYLSTLSQLANSYILYEGNSAAAFRQICEVAATSLEVTRVSVWLYNPLEEYLELAILLQEGKVQTSAEKLYQKDYPNYFRSILQKIPVAAADARNNTFTSDFNNGYIDEHDIKSMLDAPFLLGGLLGGVICCEQCGKFRQWELEDTIFVRTLGDFVSIVLLAEKVSEQNKALLTINQNLEEKVRLRTQELQQQNRQLTEYAFINSNLLQSPLARILGLAHLLAEQRDGSYDYRLMNSLIGAVEELDDVVKRIGDLLYNGSKFSKEEVRAILEKNMSGGPGKG